MISGFEEDSPRVTLAMYTRAYLAAAARRPVSTGRGLPSQLQRVTNLYCLVTEAHMCEQLAYGCCLTAERPGLDPVTLESGIESRNQYTTRPSQQPRIQPRPT